MKKIVVTGAYGQLGSEIKDAESRFPSYRFFFSDRDTLDITDREAVKQAFAEIKPDYVVNCAAYTAVDKAETDKGPSFAINRDAVGNLAAACTATGAKFLHVSTDYVFDGMASAPMKEDHPANPVSVYGESKLEGEQVAVAENSAAIIIRTSWVYSAHGNNFVKTMLRLMSSRPEIGVVADQWGSPTYAGDLAAAILQIIDSGIWVPGIYHFSNEGAINWFDFASEIKRQSGAECFVRAITTDQYPTPAKRPQYSVMDKTKIQRTFGIELKSWKESLSVCLQALQQQTS